MSKILTFALTVSALCVSCQPLPDGSAQELANWEHRAHTVTIIRDDWGIPHIFGKTDADAVFGMIYAQAEDDFNRIEANYLNAMGRLAEAEGESAIYRDLRMKLFIDPEHLQGQYEVSPAWLQALMDAWAAGLNYYLHTHPEVQPRVLTRFEPWMALSFSEGSIGGDIERISLAELQKFYGEAGDDHQTTVPLQEEEFPDGEPGGSNGFAVAPSRSASGNALLWINPHTSFFFRAELQMVSEEGLNAYGAVTWGQFFVYQGFNERAGWMHTSSFVDNIDEYFETVIRKPDGLYYRYGNEERPLTQVQIRIPYKTEAGMAEKIFTVYRTHHGPIVRKADNQWISVRMMEEPLKALTQSYSRTKARNYQEFVQTMRLHTNSSNNTVFADADGNIAYFHSNFIPRRDIRFDFNQPVDGSNPATEWGELMSVEESPNVLNPPNGWVQNTNNWPYSAAGPNSPNQQDYPPYVETRGENARGVHAIQVLDARAGFTIDSLIEAAFDGYLPAFEILIPALLDAWELTADSNPLKAELAEQIALLKAWDLRWSVASIPTALAIFWAEQLVESIGDTNWLGEIEAYKATARTTSPEVMLKALADATGTLTRDFGTWKMPWGEINRFQRLTGDIEHVFDDNAASLPVGFTSGRWGALASYGGPKDRANKKRYGTGGNSFLAAVEFGDTVKAKAITAGGQSGHPSSPHFNDQALRYTTGDLREVYFYRAQLDQHTERAYHPGEMENP